MQRRPRAVVLLSGGLDSATTLAIAKDEGYDIYALTFRYGQRHEREVEAARCVAERIGVQRHVVLDIDLRAFGGSALTADIDVPKDRDPGEIGAEVPATYVPARNTIFLAYALAFAETLGAEAIFIGVSAVDYSGYPDCRPEFIEAFERMARLATKAGAGCSDEACSTCALGLGSCPGPVTVRAPLTAMSKAATIKLGLSLGVDYSITHSCYDPPADDKACGRCDACTLRLRAFADCGVPDPVRYDGASQAYPGTGVERPTM